MIANKTRLDEVLSKNLLFVTGKGGVGKTTVAAAIALLAAESGRRTLVCEVEPKGDLGKLFGLGNAGFVAEQVRPNLSVMAMNTEEALREYLKIHLKFPVVSRLGPLAKMFDFVANAAPGVREILVVGKLCYEVRESRYDLVVVDSSASGHVVSQLSSPSGVGELLNVGMVREQTRWMLEILSDPARCGIALVSTAQETPIQEALDLAERISTETVVKLCLAIANKIMPTLFTEMEEQVFSQIDQMLSSVTLSKKNKENKLDGFFGLEDLVQATRLWQNIALGNEKQAQRLRQRSTGVAPYIQIPLVSAFSSGFGLIREVAETIEVELG